MTAVCYTHQSWNAQQQLASDKQVDLQVAQVVYTVRCSLKACLTLLIYIHMYVVSYSFLPFFVDAQSHELFLFFFIVPFCSSCDALYCQSLQLAACQQLCLGQRGRERRMCRLVMRLTSWLLSVLCQLCLLVGGGALLPVCKHTYCVCLGCVH
jgi:hypothetical protein